MTRPTKEQVDRALSFVNDTEWAGHDPDDDIYGTLAAEVRALREERDFMESESRRWRESVAKLRAELSECSAQYASAAAASEAAELRIVELRAIIARVEALLSAWKLLSWKASAYETCKPMFDQLEQALRGDDHV